MGIDDLSKEFDRADIHWRVQGTPYGRDGNYSAMALAYIDARDAMDRLDSACGPENWQDKYEVTQGGLIICSIGIRVEGGWVWKSDGAGETAVEGKKGGMSDALKRCAVKWGIGRYLYRLDSPWVPCDVKVKNGKNYWKSWKVDPWSKVKKTTYFKADESRGAADATQEKAPKQGLTKAEALGHIWDAKTKTALDGMAAKLADQYPEIAGDEKVIAAIVTMNGKFETPDSLKDDAKFLEES